MSDETFSVEVNTGMVEASFARMPDAVRASLTKAMQEGAMRLTRRAKEKVSGPVLKNRTGTLRRKISPFFRPGDDKMVAGTGIKLSYAARHEYGFTGTETVRAHARRISQVYGRPITPVTVQVATFSRRANTPARSFLRSSLREEAAGLIVDMRTALRNGLLSGGV